MITNDSLVYAASGKYISAFDVNSGATVWNARIPCGWFSSGIPSIALIESVLVVGKDGSVFGYHKDSGRLLWQNRLEGSGAYATLVTGGGSGANAALISAAATSAATAGVAAATAGSN